MQQQGSSWRLRGVHSYLGQVLVSVVLIGSFIGTYLVCWAAPDCLPHPGGEHLGGCAGDCPDVAFEGVELVRKEGVGV